MTPGEKPDLDSYFFHQSVVPIINYYPPSDPKMVGLSHVLTVPRWLGGSWTAGYLITHAWTRWLILWPIIKLRGSHTPRAEHE